MKSISFIFMIIFGFMEISHARGSGHVDFSGFFWFFADLIIGFGVYKFAKFINGGKNVTSFDYFVALMSFVIMVWLFGFAVS